MCDCIEKLRGILTKRHGDNSDVEFELRTTIDTVTMELGSALPPLGYSYSAGKGKRKKSFVAFRFCPFCGVRDAPEATLESNGCKLSDAFWRLCASQAKKGVAARKRSLQRRG